MATRTGSTIATTRGWVQKRQREIPNEAKRNTIGNHNVLLLLRGSTCLPPRFFFNREGVTNPLLAMEHLKKQKLFVATPMYGGMNHGLYMKSCLDLQSLLTQHGIEVRFSFIFNESLITRARNYLVDQFLQTNCTHMLFIDADIHFESRDVVNLLLSDKDIIGAPYPKKSINWKNVAETARKHPALDPAELQNVVGDYVFNVVQGTTKIQVNEPLEVLEIGTGFMMIKRHVFEKLKEAYPKLQFKPDFIGQADFNPQRYIHVFFDTIIDTHDSYTGGGSDRYLSEDYMFCQIWRKIGGKIYLCPWMRTQHIGTYGFKGNMPAIAQYTGHL
jgi:hypothetical protein